MTKTKHDGAEDFAALREFVRGYLNQDFVDEYGSAAGAAKAFCEDADADERARVATEWTKFAGEAAGLSVDAVNGKLAQLGGAWSVTDVAELSAVTAVFEEYVKK